MIRALATVDQVIDALGGTSAVARLVGKWPSAISNWRVRGVMPADTLLVISNALKAIRKNAPPSLWDVADGKAPKSRKQKQRSSAKV